MVHSRATRTNRFGARPLSEVEWQYPVGHASSRWRRFAAWLAMRLLKLTGAQVMEPIGEVKWISFDETKFAALVNAQQGNLRRIFKLDARFLVIGRRTAEEVISGWAQEDPLFFQAGPTDYLEAFYEHVRQRFDLIVIVVPWIDGHFLLPDLSSVAGGRAW